MFSKNVYCSPVQGVIQIHGKPLPGLKITRTLISGGFKGRRHTDSTTTNANGKFELPEVSNRTFLRPDLLSPYPRVDQEFLLTYEGKDYGIWEFTKENFELGGEVNEPDKVIHMMCDLKDVESAGEARIVRCVSNELTRSQ